MVTLTKSTKPQREINVQREWHMVDMKDQVLGRIAGKIAAYLQGKHKRNYVPYLDMGDYVVIINARKTLLTGKKLQSKYYTRYSGYPGGLKKISVSNLMENKPEEVIRHAISGMLPKNKLRSRRLKRLYVFSDERHPYGDKLKAQNSNRKTKSQN
ncbi:50S ribosomal protein L13 [Candidatus Roizmanbacteria bacterium]|nr:50S ribosomal protein L13 [Candidatus Roizmanbacteria bacterium]